MRTLDEVIDALEVCSQIDAECDKCPYKSTAKGWCEEKDRDALHYLRIFQAHEQRVRDQLDALKDEYRPNDPLTWDELREMEGKPVWVEHKHYSKWLIVYEVYEHTIVLDGNGFYVQYFSDDNEKEIRWKAYKKER